MTARDAGAVASRVLAVFTFISASRSFTAFLSAAEEWRSLNERALLSSVLFFGAVTGLLLAMAVLLWFQAGRFWNPSVEDGPPLTLGSGYRLALCLIGAYLFFSHAVAVLGSLSLLTHSSEMADLAWRNVRAEAFTHLVGAIVGVTLFFWNRHAGTAAKGAVALDT